MIIDSWTDYVIAIGVILGLWSFIYKFMEKRQ